MATFPVAGDSGSDAHGVGAMLRRARRQRQLSLEDIARVTKIRVAILRAIETDQEDQLPATIYRRAFVRAYAHEVGLDPDDTARRYFEQFEPPAAPAPASPDADAVHAALKRDTWTPSTHADDMWRAVGRQWIAMLIIAAAVLAYGVARRAGHPASAAPPATAQAPEKTEVGTTGSRESTTAPAGQSGVLHLDIHPRGACWVSADVDGARVAYSLMSAGERRTLEVHREASLRIGDPATFAFSIDGIPGSPLGRAGEPVTVHVTRENYRDLLAR